MYFQIGVHTCPVYVSKMKAASIMYVHLLIAAAATLTLTEGTPNWEWTETDEPNWENPTVEGLLNHIPAPNFTLRVQEDHTQGKQVIKVGVNVN